MFYARIKTESQPIFQNPFIQSVWRRFVKKRTGMFSKIMSAEQVGALQVSHFHTLDVCSAIVLAIAVFYATKRGFSRPHLILTYSR